MTLEISVNEGKCVGCIVSQALVFCCDKRTRLLKAVENPFDEPPFVNARFLRGQRSIFQAIANQPNSELAMASERGNLLAVQGATKGQKIVGGDSCHTVKAPLLI